MNGFTPFENRMKTDYEDFRDLLKTIGANLKELRVARKQSIEAVAAAIELPTLMLEGIEEGECDLGLGLLLDLCCYYEVNAVDVVSVKANHVQK